ncbi:MAG: ArsR/SmtB family transcription factor [Ancrocorticia sp.]|uniref:ArsR/SmtB family transcription factor n=1 Tax=Ancrocorticia sp. TaxID=2593684 RepID=UPI003F915DE1
MNTNAPTPQPEPAAPANDPKLVELSTRAFEAGQALHDYVAGEPTTLKARPPLTFAGMSFQLAANDISALGHPIRLHICELTAGEPVSVKELVEKLNMGTTGQVYHHLRTLLDFEWVQNAGRSSYRLNPDRAESLAIILSVIKK